MTESHCATRPLTGDQLPRRLWAALAKPSVRQTGLHLQMQETCGSAASLVEVAGRLESALAMGQ